MKHNSVIYLITDLDYGGAESQLVRLATCFKKRRWKVGIISMLSGGSYVNELEKAGIVVISLGMRRGMPDPRAVFRLAHILRQWKPQILISFMFHANLLARLTRLIVQIPALVCSARSVNEKGTKSRNARWREIAYRLTDSLCDLTIQNSRAGLKRYVQIKAVHPHKILYIPNGVDTKRFRSDRGLRERFRIHLGLEGFFVWLAVGRFEPEKDYPTMIHAFSKVCQVYPRIKFLFVGSGSLIEEARNLVSKLNLKQSSRFLGVRKDVSALMNAADAYILSSAWEGMPNVLLEATASELPIIATDIDGNREVVLNGQTGFLVPLRNPEALANSMLQVMQMSDIARQRMGKIGRAYIQTNYSLDQVVDMWEELYNKLIERKQIGP